MKIYVSEPTAKLRYLSLVGVIDRKTLVFLSSSCVLSCMQYLRVSGMIVGPREKSEISELSSHLERLEILKKAH